MRCRTYQIFDVCLAYSSKKHLFIASAFGSAYLFIVPTLSQAFACDVGTATAGFVIYILAWGPGPLLWAPLSESIGRKPVYVGSALLWTLFNLGCAKAQSIAVMIICRFLAGLFGCACLTNGGGTNLDIWRGVAISRAIALYSAVLFLGKSSLSYCSCTLITYIIAVLPVYRTCLRTNYRWHHPKIRRHHRRSKCWRVALVVLFSGNPWVFVNSSVPLLTGDPPWNTDACACSQRRQRRTRE